MRHYSCTLHFTYSPEKTSMFLGHALKVLGFSPGVMFIQIDNKDSLEDEPFDETFLYSILSKKPTTIQLMNKSYDENEDYYWFRLKIDEGYNILRVEWLNSNLHFLLNSEPLSHFLQSAGFICGNCCDNADRYEQSKERIEYFVNKTPKDPFDIEKIEEKVDVSKHWGRSVKACGVEFMAAPLMWFGENYYNVIPKDKLLQFKHATYTSTSDAEIVTVNLFNLYESPAKSENRNKQEEFWKFFDFVNIISEYQRKNEIDPVKALNDLLAKRKKR